MKLNMDIKDIKEEVSKKIVSLAQHGKKGLKPKKGEKRKLKQSEKGIVMIIFSLVIGYCVYNFVLTPISNNRAIVEKTKNETAKKRDDLEAEINNRGKTLQQINELEKEVEGYNKKFPNARTRNEILVIANKMFSEAGVKLDSLEVAEVVPVTKEEIGVSIINKGIAKSIKSEKLFTANIQTDGTTAKAPEKPETPSTDPNAKAPEATQQPFDSTIANFKVSDLAYSDAYGLIEKINKTERLIIPNTLNVIKGGDSKYSVEGSLLFYTYRNSDPIELF
ncbi:MAG: hypothetical protein RR500_00810 [Bacilli bacterium]